MCRPHQSPRLAQAPPTRCNSKVRTSKRSCRLRCTTYYVMVLLLLYHLIVYVFIHKSFAIMVHCFHHLNSEQDLSVSSNYDYMYVCTQSSTKQHYHRHLLHHRHHHRRRLHPHRHDGRHYWHHRHVVIISLRIIVIINNII